MHKGDECGGLVHQESSVYALEILAMGNSSLKSPWKDRPLCECQKTAKASPVSNTCIWRDAFLSIASFASDPLLSTSGGIRSTRDTQPTAIVPDKP